MSRLTISEYEVSFHSADFTISTSVETTTGSDDDHVIEIALGKIMLVLNLNLHKLYDYAEVECVQEVYP